MAPWPETGTFVVTPIHQEPKTLLSPLKGNGRVLKSIGPASYSKVSGYLLTGE
jgi:hypothetical protein